MVSSDLVRLCCGHVFPKYDNNDITFRLPRFERESGDEDREHITKLETHIPGHLFD